MTATTLTLADATARHDLQVLAHLDVQATIPTATGPVAQGDVLLLPVPPAPAGEPVPAGGVVLVAGEHAHTLVAPDGHATWRVEDVGQTVGWVGVSGADVLVMHAEHGAVALAPGCWQVRRQRESDGMRSRLVMD